MFKQGTTVVHKTHGVGVIDKIEERDFSGKMSKFYIVTIQDQGCPKKVFVPVECAKDRIRPVLTSFDPVFSALHEHRKAGIDHQTWNRRYREYMERIQTGEAIEVATVLGSLHALKNAKDLSFGERKLFDHAKDLLCKELSACEGISIRDAEARIEYELNTVK